MLTDFARWVGPIHSAAGSQHPSRSFRGYFWSSFPLAGSRGWLGLLVLPHYSFQCQEATSGNVTPMWQCSTGISFRSSVQCCSLTLHPWGVQTAWMTLERPPCLAVNEQVRFVTGLCACARKQWSPAGPSPFVLVSCPRHPETFTPKVSIPYENIHIPCVNYTDVKDNNNKFFLIKKKLHPL